MAVKVTLPPNPGGQRERTVRIKTGGAIMEVGHTLYVGDGKGQGAGLNERMGMVVAMFHPGTWLRGEVTE